MTSSCRPCCALTSHQRFDNGGCFDGCGFGFGEGDKQSTLTTMRSIYYTIQIKINISKKVVDLL